MCCDCKLKELLYMTAGIGSSSTPFPELEMDGWMDGQLTDWLISLEGLAIFKSPKHYSRILFLTQFQVSETSIDRFPCALSIIILFKGALPVKIWLMDKWLCIIFKHSLMWCRMYTGESVNALCPVPELAKPPWITFSPPFFTAGLQFRYWKDNFGLCQGYCYS